MNSVIRVGIIGYYGQKRRKRLEKYGTGKNAHLGPYKETLTLNPRNNKLEYVKHPVAAWIFGFLFTVLGIVIIAEILVGRAQEIFPRIKPGAWWEYLVGALTFLVGLSFFMAATSEYVEFDREIDVIVQDKKSIFCREYKTMRTLQKFKEIEIVRKGFHNKSNFKNDTTHYELILYFEDEPPLEILETSNRYEIKQKYLDISYFLGKEVDLEKIEITDLTRTTTGQKTRKKPRPSETSYEVARI